MAEYYDPYSQGEYNYNYNYNQDPYGNYDPGYDPNFGYAVDGYNNADPYASTSPPPPPDKHWVDPMRVNREYLKKITGSCIYEDFDGLKEKGLFLLEVLIRRITLKKSLVENFQGNQSQNSDSKGLFKPVSCVRFLNFPFLEVKGVDDGELLNTPSDSREKMFTNLFQEVFTTTGRRHDSLVIEPEEEEEEQGKKRSGGTENLRASDKTEVEKELKEEEVMFVIMEGKSVMVPMTGLSMAQQLLGHPLVVRVNHPGETGDAETLGTSTVRSPGSFSRAILLSCQADSVLPCLGVSNGVHDLIATGGEKVGTVELTITLTCFGKGVVNCIMGHDYEHSYILKQLKMKHSTAKDPYMSPGLAADLMEMDVSYYPDEKTSSQVLVECVGNDLVPLGDSERRHALGTSDCEWFRMLRKAYPPPPPLDHEEILRQIAMEDARLLMQQRQICRDLLKRGPPTRASFDERLRELQTLRNMMEEKSFESKKSLEEYKGDSYIQTGMTGLETGNPFQEAARGSETVSLSRFVEEERRSKASKKNKKSSNSKQNKSLRG